MRNSTRYGFMIKLLPCHAEAELRVEVGVEWLPESGRSLIEVGWG